MSKPRKQIRVAERKFALMLILLLAIMGIAPAAILEYVIVTHAAGETLSVRVIVIAILLLTGGFLFMAGGLGMWAFRSSMDGEKQRMIGRFVSAMEYLNDGLICLNDRGVVVASNESVRQYFASTEKEEFLLSDVFPELSAGDMKELLNPDIRQELERPISRHGVSKVLRFRSQHEESMNLLLVSDVTDQRVKEMELRQQAQLQFIGRIARGVAHDFNNILCAISGHAALMERGDREPADNESLGVILKESHRGAGLARRLLELSRESSPLDSTVSLKTIIEGTEELLRMAMKEPVDVQYEFSGDECSLPLGPAQIEQAIVNLGVLAVDHRNEAMPVESLTVSLAHSAGREAHLSVYLIYQADTPATLKEHVLEEIDRTGGDGVILSVVASLVQEVGGELLQLRDGEVPVGYRAHLPVLHGPAISNAEEPPPIDEMKYFESWNILVGLNGDARKSEIESLGSHDASKLIVACDLPQMLSELEKTGHWNLIIIDETLCGEEVDAVVRVISTLNAEAVLVVLSMTPGEPSRMTEVSNSYQIDASLPFPEMFHRIHTMVQTG